MNTFVAFILALLPIIWLVVALTVLKMKGYLAVVTSMCLAVILALFAFKMPFLDCFTAMIEGAAFGLWPIILVIIAAMFCYNLTVKTGAMEVIKQMITSVSPDKRVLILLIGWCFGGFMEAMAGFGTAIAIPASMLVGLGFGPITAAVACMLANSVPTVFGSIGIPTVTLAKVAEVAPDMLSAYTVLQLAPWFIIVPFLMVAVCGGGAKAIKGVFPITLVAGLSFVVPMYFVGRFLGPELTDVIGSICSLICTIGMGYAMRNKPIPEEYDMRKNIPAGDKIDTATAVKSWLPFILIFALLLLTSKLIPGLYNVLSSIKSNVVFYTGENPATITFTWIATPGVMIFIAAIIGGIVQKATWGEMGEVFKATFIQMWPTVITIVCVLAMAKVMGYSGMISAIATAIILVTGSAYPYFAPLFGFIGAFVTGSGTSSEVLFGKLQAETAMAIGASPVWLAASNSLGAGMGKVISPQCLAIASGSVNNPENGESIMLKKTAPFVIVMTILGCVISGLFSGMIPLG